MIRPIAVCYAIACGVSWLVWAPMVLGIVGPTPAMIAAGTLGPLLGCFVTHRLYEGNWRAVRVTPRRWLWVVLGPLLVIACFFVLFPALISEGSPARWNWRPAALSGIFVPMFNYNLFAGPLFEEFGWRGFLQTRLQKSLQPWIAAVVVGVMWAAWHTPLFWLEGWSSASPLAYIAIVVGLSLVMTFGFNASGGSVAVAILMHSAFNSSPRFLGPYLGETPLRSYPSGEWFIAFAFLLAGIALAAGSRGRLGHKAGR